ncbi:myosin heavy chain, muscle isoform X2 [Polistes fuscatus]|uniref:myosin heavy chain, muscle isoform X2 n=1 Tax=Polistes fuscatus TaxID=30207 RepID=UPI001CAA12D8|nr:myosin heavy chain, muscle isoform X2 [Polistes fuscatus]
MDFFNSAKSPIERCSFDETSMDSYSLVTVTEDRVNDFSEDIVKDGNDIEVTSLEEAKSVIATLRAKQRAQAHQMLAWRRTLKLQEELVARLTREKAEQLCTLSSQLFLFESRLCRKQKEIEANLVQRESIILRQQRMIRQLQSRLAERSGTGTRDSPPYDAHDRLDSLGDSDSAVVLEEAADDPAPPRFRSNITDVTVIRSVSDAVEPSSKYSSMRRCNGFLRRPEILETVYSVEEDGDSESNQEPPESMENYECDERRTKNLGNGKGRLQELYGSFERLAQETDSLENEKPRDESQQAQVTYNRVMSNHRSVTKPKDVKYKRINKAKSKSLEELRGRLRNWVEKGNKIAISLDQSYA